ncbi:hypothetical protein MNBD_GAMMA13-701 [hydrothermal vent metagenome]|uniref:Uncharacterized protein n=1 Tax=hydrothermal vent metagenome TaxID=652676 RepID=A0A3B0Y3V3_9ZZZZ
MTNNDKHDLNKAWLSAQGAPVGETPTCDLDKYREHVEDFDLSEADQTELLQILWSIMAAFVNLGFGVDSVQLLKAEASQPEDGLQVRKETDHDK